MCLAAATHLVSGLLCLSRTCCGFSDLIKTILFYLSLCLSLSFFFLSLLPVTVNLWWWHGCSRGLCSHSAGPLVTLPRAGSNISARWFQTRGKIKFLLIPETVFCLFVLFCLHCKKISIFQKCFFSSLASVSDLTWTLATWSCTGLFGYNASKFSRCNNNWETNSEYKILYGIYCNISFERQIRKQVQ